MIKTTCKVCKAEFDINKCNIKDSGNCCSYECRGKSVTTKEKRNCIECGKEFVAQQYQIKNRKIVCCSKQCSYAQKRTKYVGKKFGKLTVVRDIGVIDRNGQKNTFYECKCDCGNTKNICISNLSGGIQSCGCSPNRWHNAPGQGWFNVYYSRYKSSAKKRNIQFLLTKEDFSKIIFEDCYYCSEPPKKRVWNLSKKIFREVIPCNGIDRVDSDKHYSLDNCVPCCDICNMMKLDSNVDTFLSHIEKIHDFQNYKKESRKPTFTVIA